MRKKQRRQEKKMEAPQLNSEDTVVEDQAAIETSTANREAAALEEQLAAERIAQARAMNEAAAEAKPAPAPEETMGSLASKGRDALLERLRAREAEKNVPSYVPPPRTERQLSQLELEMEAGRRAVAKHQAQLAARPNPPANHVKEGFSTPVYRPGDVVPDPKVPPSPEGFAAGTKPYSADV